MIPITKSDSEVHNSHGCAVNDLSVVKFSLELQNVFEDAGGQVVVMVVVVVVVEWDKSTKHGKRVNALAGMLVRRN